MDCKHLILSAWAGITSPSFNQPALFRLGMGRSPGDSLFYNRTVPSEANKQYETKSRERCNILASGNTLCVPTVFCQPLRESSGAEGGKGRVGKMRDESADLKCKAPQGLGLHHHPHQEWQMWDTTVREFGCHSTMCIKPLLCAVKQMWWPKITSAPGPGERRENKDQAPFHYHKCIPHQQLLFGLCLCSSYFFDDKKPFILCNESVSKYLFIFFKHPIGQLYRERLFINPPVLF